MPKSTLTQSAANAFPRWTEMRTDSQSLGQALLNAAAVTAEDLEQNMFEINLSRNLVTANVQTLSVFYYLVLGNDFKFSINNDQIDRPFFELPTVTATLEDDSELVLESVENNSLEGLIKALPTRLVLEETVPHTVDLLNTTIESINFDVNTSLASPNHLAVTMSGGQVYLDILERDNRIVRGRVVLEGKNTASSKQVETLMFIHDDTRFSEKQWSSLDKVSIYEVEPRATTNIVVQDHRFNLNDLPDVYNFGEDVEREFLDTFWSLGENSTTLTSVLEKRAWDSEVRQRINGTDISNTENAITSLSSLTKSTSIPYHLLDESMAGLVATDFALKPFTDLVYVVSGQNLYIYDNKEPDVDRKKMDLRFSEVNIQAKISVDRHDYYQHEQAQLSFHWVNPAKTLRQHRVYYETPSGDKFELLNGISTPFGSNAFFVDQPTVTNHLRPPEKINLNSRGDWIFTLEAHYLDQSIEYDQIILRVPSKTPLAVFDLSAELGAETLVGVDFDKAGRLWVLDSALTPMRHRFKEQKDYFLVDFNEPRILTIEEYAFLRVTP